MRYHYSGEVKEGYSILDNIDCYLQVGSFEYKSTYKKGFMIFSIFTNKDCNKWFEEFNANNPEAMLNLIDNEETE